MQRRNLCCSPSPQLLARKAHLANIMGGIYLFSFVPVMAVSHRPVTDQSLPWMLRQPLRRALRVVKARALMWRGVMDTGSPLALSVAGTWGGKRDFAKAGTGKFGGVGFSPAASACLKEQHVDERL